MIIEETFVIHAPIQKAWDFFLDINRMARCLPGAEVRQIDADNFEGTLTVNVGPLGPSFSGSVAIRKHPPIIA